MSPFQFHCRLGYPSLEVLKRLCPYLESMSSLSCDSCLFDKHHQNVYLPCLNKSAQELFDIVHSDVLVPCMVTLMFGFKVFLLFLLITSIMQLGYI